MNPLQPRTATDTEIEPPPAAVAAAPLPDLTTQRQRALLERLMRLVARRAKDEVEIRAHNADHVAAAKRAFDEQKQRATTQFETQHAQQIAAYRAAREAILLRYEAQGAALALEEQKVADEAGQRLADSLDDAKSLRQHQFKETQRAFDEHVVAPKAEFFAFKQMCEQRAAEVHALTAEAQQIVRRRGPWPAEPTEQPASPPGLSKHEYWDRVSAAINVARAKIQELQSQPAARFNEDGWPVLIFLFAIPVLIYPFWLLLGSFGWLWTSVACVTTGLVLAIGARQVVRPFARRQTLRIVPDFQQAAAQALADLTAALHAAKAEGEAIHRGLVEQRLATLTAAKADYKKTRREQKSQHAERVRQTATDVGRRRAAVEVAHEAELQQLEDQYAPEIERLEQTYQQQIVSLSESYRASRAEQRGQFERDWSDLVTGWTAGLAEFEQVIDIMNQVCDARFPAWEGASTADFAQHKPRDVNALCFGHYRLDLEQLEGGLPQHDALQQPRAAFDLPAVLSYPECPSLLIEAEGDGRDAATRVFQNVMLRLLTTFPPGKVRFTIIDPVGLGQNFSAFMHLADYDERLVANRIWTESAHINQRLADLTEHMENVIQKYLRNEFASIQEYNAQAGEVAEAYQILVVSNFPANFSEEAARRLVSIAKSGARCGVYTLISTDGKLKLPRNFDMADLEADAATLVWDGAKNQFRWNHADLRDLPLTLESPPDDERFTEIVRAVGQVAKDSSRVEVPFESILPADDRWWAADSRAEIEVPLGRAGAKKLQHMRLGKGTSQHVLIAGKTGSGKSTLLNAMITSLAVHYSPNELQFYLIDFKKGVEFKAYAALRLPHARVIAIESEREFGMSVLERLDQELKRRGDLFRQAGVQDLKGFRNGDPTAIMPRILLVIDEFQEFFTSDDKIAHDSSLLLDRLVRQGRAFGIHVLLGSQTLAGAYSLARSTLGQMAVRIALQCSESDAHLILSEDNTAARLLSRPGEAIYNDANGMFEGNHPFQVVWLSDHQREGYLRQLAKMADEQQLVREPPTVFEGNVAADPLSNVPLGELLQAASQALPAAAAASEAPIAWLGSAVAIKPPTNVVFRRQSGSNLLIVGQQEELALGMLTNCLISLSAQGPLAAPSVARELQRCYVLDGTRPESPEGDFWPSLQRRLHLNAAIVAPRDAADVVRRIAAEVDRRLTAGDSSADPIFLFIHNLARFRDLKKSDDFGMSFDEPTGAGADKQLTTILREGPALGVHTLVWCDSFNNVSRWLDRQTLRDLELRVLLQMSATDSSNLMDSPAASRLGNYLALLHSEEQGHSEKFRPYGLPSEAWLARVALWLRPVGP